MSNVRLQSTSTHVIRLERGQDPATIALDGTATALVTPAPAEEDGDTVSAPAATTVPIETEPAAAATSLEPNDSAASAHDAETSSPVRIVPVSMSRASLLIVAPPVPR